MGDIDNLGCTEYDGWVEYHNRVPFTSERQDLLLASLISVTCNVNRDPAKHPAFTPQDFMPWVKQEAAPVDQDEADAEIARQGNMLKAQLEARNHA